MNSPALKLANRKVLVTGAAGFIGSHLVETLLKLDTQVIGLDNLSTGSLSNLKEARKDNRFKFVQGDIRNRTIVEKTTEKMDYIFHQAALVDVQGSIRDPQLFHDVNVGGTLNILWGAHQNETCKFVFASSAAVYGEQKMLPIRESAAQAPDTPYGLTKLIGEKYCLLFHQTYGVKTVILRYFNVYGPRQNPLNPYSGVISKFISNALSGDHLTIYGDGEQTRDFVFVEDIITANLLAATTPEADRKILNIGSGKQVTINQLAEKIIDLCARPNVHLKHVNPRQGDIKHSRADITSAKHILKYEVKYDLRRGLKQTIQSQLIH